MEQRQPKFAPNQYSTGWEQQETTFLTKRGGQKFEVRGVVADCFRFDRYYSRFYRLFRTVVLGEPFQLRKSGRNIYGASSEYSVLRIVAQSGGDAINVLCCGECGLVAAGDEVTMQVRCNQAGDYILLGGINHSTNARIHRDPLTISPVALRIWAVAMVLLLALLVSWLANGGITQIISGILSAFGWLLSVLWRALGQTALMVVGLIWLVKSLFKK